jgi:hypothetical protein
MKRIAKSLALAGGVLVTLGVCAAVYVYSVTKPMILGDITASWAHSMRAFAISHDAKLPTTWREFVNWEKEQNPNYRITPEEMEKRFRIHQYDLRKGTESTIYIEVIDPKLKGMEDYVNRTVRTAIYETPNKNGAANGSQPIRSETHSTSPAAGSRR